MRTSKFISAVIVGTLSYVGMTNVARAQAAPLPTGTVLQIGSTPLVGGSVSVNPDGSFALVGQQQGGSANGGAVWDLAWNMTLNQDPSIAGTLTLRNLTTSTRNFNLFFQLPVAAPIASSVFGGSITATAYDDNGDANVTLAPNSSAPSIYRGQIDGSTVLSLFAASLQCLPNAPNCSTGGSEVDGFPGPTRPGPSAASSIGLLLNFTLTPGDRAVFDVNFTVEPAAPVPLPATLPLLAAGLGAFGSWRRRRTR